MIVILIGLSTGDHAWTILPKLSHEKLDVYQKSIKYLALSASIAAKLPRGNGDLADQLKRAALSVPLNIAEACGHTGSLDNARHFAIARGSALESGAIVDACHALGLVDLSTCREAKLLLVAIVSMLSKLCVRRFPNSQVARRRPDQDHDHD